MTSALFGTCLDCHVVVLVLSAAVLVIEADWKKTITSTVRLPLTETITSTVRLPLTEHEHEWAWVVAEHRVTYQGPCEERVF